MEASVEASAKRSGRGMAAMLSCAVGRRFGARAGFRFSSRRRAAFLVRFIWKKFHDKPAFL